MNGSTISEQVSTLDVKLAVREYLIVASHMLQQGQPDSEESCIMLESGPTNFTKLLQCLSLAVREFCAAGDEHCE